MVFILFFGLFNMYNCRAGEELCWCYAFVGEHIKIRVDDQASPPGSPEDVRAENAEAGQAQLERREFDVRSDETSKPSTPAATATTQSASFSVSIQNAPDEAASAAPAATTPSQMCTPLRGTESHRGIREDGSPQLGSGAGSAFQTPLRSTGSNSILFNFDEPISDEDVHEEEWTEFVAGDNIRIKKKGSVVQDVVTGRMVSKQNGKVQRYVTATFGVISARDVVRDCDTPRPASGPVADQLSDDDDNKRDDATIDAANPSAVFALASTRQGTDHLVFELGDRDSAPMPALWKLFNNPKYRGGFLARSIFCEATKEKDTNVLPMPWTGGTSLKSTIADKKVQEQEWLGWTENDIVNEWVRKRVFSIIVSNPRADLTVTWKGRSTQMAIHGAASIVVTESHRCRIAHLAVDPRAKMLINLIYGSKGERSDLEDHDLRVAQLWNEVARDHVNAPQWVPFSVMTLPVYDNIDVTACPPQPGLDATTIKEIWMALRTDWSRLQVATKSKTGASLLVNGSIYDNVWNHFVCGNRMVFAHKVSAMYCFELWDKHDGMLPQWCNRTLPNETGVSAGVSTSADSMSLASSTPKSKSQGRDGKETPQPDSSARLCTLLETFMKASASDMISLGAELRALETADNLIKDGDPMKTQIKERIRQCTIKLLSGSDRPASFQPGSPPPSH